MSDSSIAQKNLAIKDVVLRSSTISTREDFELFNDHKVNSCLAQYYQRAEEIEVLALPDQGPDQNLMIWVYAFSYTVGVRLVAPDETTQADADDYIPVAQIISTFKSRYFSEIELCEESLQEFSKDNVGFNVWPYWREYVQSTCARLGMTGAISVPLYRMQKKAEDRATVALESAHQQ